MTQDEMVGVAKWAVDVADEYKTTYSRVIEIFKAIYKYHADVTAVKNMMEIGMGGAK